MTDKLTNSKLYLFLYTMKEYQRFSGELCSHELTADCLIMEKGIYSMLKKDMRDIC